MAEEQGTPVSQDPAQTTASEQQSAPTPTVGDGPWAADIRQAFTDPQVAAQVDAFMRSRVQPRMTQQEQALAEAQGAREFLNAFQENPEAAYIEISRQMYGDEYANALAQQAQEQQQYEQYIASQQQYQPTPVQQVDPRVQAMLDDYEQRTENERYQREKAEFLSNPMYADVNPNLFDPFVGAADTWEEAVEMYRAHNAQLAQNAPEPTPDPDPVPTINSETGGAAGEAAPTYSVAGKSLNEVIDDAFGHLGAPDPPPPPTV